MNEAPRVHRLTMFKHGIAHIERAGPGKGSFELSFERDAMNDVLKSLAVWVKEGDARVGAVSFDSPEDPEDELRERGLLFEKGAALRELVYALRGRRVGIATGADEVTGEVIGIESTYDREARHVQSLVLRGEDGTVTLVDAQRVQRVSLLEETSRADLDLLVDKSRAASDRDRRRVRVALSGESPDVRIAYVVPAPTWRVSYRLVAEEDAVHVMAWGIVHNPTDEDLEDIELVLTTGQPVSFVIALYEPRHVERAVVEESERAVAAPKQYQAARPPPAPMAAPRMAAAPMGQPAALDMADEGYVLEQYRGPAPVQETAEAQERGELFEYRVRTKVTLPRGGSAMVPLVSARVPSKKERIWRTGQGPAPDIVLRFENETGAVLEEGPAVIYEDGGYAGEAMVPYSARGAEVRLGFARDLAVRCRKEQKSEVFLAGIRLADRAAIESHERRVRHTLSAESDHDEPVEIAFEIPRPHDHEIAPDGPQPAETTAGYWRFRLEVPPHASAELVVVERWRTSHRVEVEALTDHRLKNWIEGRFLDDATMEEVQAVAASWEKAKRIDEEVKVLETRRRGIGESQSRLMEQLRVLAQGGEEGALRTRHVRKLEDLQKQTEQLEAQIAARVDEAEKLRNEARAALSELGSSAGAQ